MLKQTKRRTDLKLGLLLPVLLSMAACANVDTQKVKNDFSTLGSKIGSGVSTAGSAIGSGVSTAKTKLTSKGPSKKSRQANDALAIVSKYPTSEVPHTLMRKPVATGRLTSGHGYRLSPTGIPLPRKHKGVDYAAPNGTAIYAAGNGVIDRIYKSTSYGNYIRIEHDNGFFTAYAHMHNFADGLKSGSAVSRGQTIGYVGTTGRSSGDHLHYELIYKGKFIDPLFEYEEKTTTTAAVEP